MISVSNLFKDNKYPAWITSHPIFSKIENVRKAFPAIGLSNFEDKFLTDNSKEIKIYANALLDVISEKLIKRSTKLASFGKKAKIGKVRLNNLQQIVALMQSIIDMIALDKSAFHSVLESGKVSIGLPADLQYLDTLFLKKGTGIFKVYEKINSMLVENKFLPLIPLAELSPFKNFSAFNLPGKEMFIRFSSDGADGIWDIATMSMRGIASCQTWADGLSNSIKIIGSIVDPFTGIIYLTNGERFNNYGSKMTRRCVVRYILNKNGEATLILEKMYPIFDPASLEDFVKALKARVPDINIEYAPNLFTKYYKYDYYIPLSDELNLIGSSSYYPYVDSGLNFVRDEKCALAKIPVSPQSLFKKEMPAIFNKIIKSNHFSRLKISKFGLNAINLMAKLRGISPIDPNTCKCKKTSCTKSHKTEFSSSLQNVNLQQLNDNFVNFVVNKSGNDDPYKFIKEHEKDCVDFFQSEFGKNSDDVFSSFFVANILNSLN